MSGGAPSPIPTGGREVPAAFRILVAHAPKLGELQADMTKLAGEGFYFAAWHVSDDGCHFEVVMWRPKGWEMPPSPAKEGGAP